VASYARQNQITWPIIVDSDRSLEQRCSVGQISLNNIWQMRLITGDGRLAPGNTADVDGSADRALQGASWNVDPAGMPANLKPAWMAVEFGNYPAAAVNVKTGLKSNKPDVKAASEKLHGYVMQKLDARFNAAKQAAAGGNKWESYKAYSSLLVEFKGYEVPEEAESAAKELSADDAVKAELAALKRLDSARKMLASPTTQKRALKLLEQLIADAPTTEAAQQARQILAQASPAGQR
jgi:hypothetical protein